MYRIIVLTTDGHSREDGNVYYSEYLLVTAISGQTFSEPIFHLAESPGETFYTEETFTKTVRALGYKVEKPPGPSFVIVSGENDSDDSDEDQDESTEEEPVSIKGRSIEDVLKGY